VATGKSIPHIYAAQESTSICHKALLVNGPAGGKAGSSPEGSQDRRPRPVCPTVSLAASLSKIAD